MFYTYILYSSKAKIFYFGYTANLLKRVSEHNNRLSFATKPYLPWKLVWYCGFAKERDAKAFELYLKSGAGKAFAYKRLVCSFKER